MKYTRDSSIQKFMLHATHVLNYLEGTPEAQNVLVQYGFAIQKLPQGRQLLEQTKLLNRDYEELLQRQKYATEQFNEQWKTLSTLHQVHLQAARRCLQTELATLLNSRESSYTGRVVQIERFYTALLNNADYQSKMHGLSISTEELTRGQQMLTQLTITKDQQNRSQYNLNSLQQQKEAKSAEFKRWFSALTALARVAFQDQPAMRQMMRTNPIRTVSETKSPAADVNAVAVAA